MTFLGPVGAIQRFFLYLLLIEGKKKYLSSTRLVLINFFPRKQEYVFLISVSFGNLVVEETWENRGLFIIIPMLLL